MHSSLSDIRERANVGTDPVVLFSVRRSCKYGVCGHRSDARGLEKKVSQSWKGIQMRLKAQFDLFHLTAPFSFLGQIASSVCLVQIICRRVVGLVWFGDYDAKTLVTSDHITRREGKQIKPLPKKMGIFLFRILRLYECENVF